MQRLVVEGSIYTYQNTEEYTNTNVHHRTPTGTMSFMRSIKDIVPVWSSFKDTSELIFIELSKDLKKQKQEVCSGTKTCTALHISGTFQLCQLLLNS